jgi:SAM-dependent methyltransferase
MSELPESRRSARNRELWDRHSDEYQAAHGPQLAASGGLAWGVWQIPESDLDILGNICDRDVLELGCGAGQWSIALHALGARVTGLDISGRQLEHARLLMTDAAVEFPLAHSAAETTPFKDASFDVVFSDHGAMTFADPYLTVPEVARILRPGGLLAFSMHTPILDIAWKPEADHPGDKLIEDYWDLHLIEQPDEPVAFQLRYGEWIRVFVENRFAIESLIELRPTADALSSYRDVVDRDWARRWPMEHIWRVRRTAAAERRSAPANRRMIEQFDLEGCPPPVPARKTENLDGDC